MTLDELKKSPILVEIKQLAELFSEIRNEFAIKNGWVYPKRILPDKEPWNGKNFKHFAKFYKLLKSIKVDASDYIKAQFYLVKNREAYITDLNSEYAIKRYKKFMKDKTAYEKPDLQANIPFMRDKDKNFLILYANNNKIKNLWKHMETYDGIKMPVVIKLFFLKQISHHFITEYSPKLTLHWMEKMVDEKILSTLDYKKIQLAVQRGRTTADEYE